MCFRCVVRTPDSLAFCTSESLRWHWAFQQEEGEGQKSETSERGCEIWREEWRRKTVKVKEEGRSDSFLLCSPTPRGFFLFISLPLALWASSGDSLEASSTSRLLPICLAVSLGRSWKTLKCSLYPKPGVKVARCPLCLCLLSPSLLRTASICFLLFWPLLFSSLDGSALIGERSAALRPQPEHQSLSSALALVGTESETDFLSVTQIRPGTVTLLSVMADRNKKLSS